MTPSVGLFHTQTLEISHLIFSTPFGVNLLFADLYIGDELPPPLMSCQMHFEILAAAAKIATGLSRNKFIDPPQLTDRRPNNELTNAR